MDHVSPEREHDADGTRRTAGRVLTRRLFATALVLLALAFTALGVWQLERRIWKLRLIDQVKARIHAPPAPLAATQPMRPDDAYRRVVVRGVLETDREALVQAVTERGPGWWVMTPLKTAAGTILVNRGFVPPERKAPASRPLPAPGQPITIVGLLRASEPHGGFLRANDPAADRWYSRDVVAIARARGLGRVAPMFIDAEASADPKAYPIGGLTVVKFRNAHFSYALTWFGLAGLSVFGLVTVLRAKGPADG